MSLPTQQQFQIHLPGLLRVLAESLYSTEKVAIRELLQNANDSIVRRRIEYKERDFQPRIEVTVDREHSSIQIRDNGSGLTQEEIDAYLSTIGRSYTRQLNEDTAVFSPQQAEALIGQFGMGFLSAFLIAAEVRLVTQSAAQANPSIEWRSAGDIHYTTRIIDGQPTGTRVELILKPSANYLLEREILVKLIREYADFLDVPIYLTGQAEPLNLRAFPWETQAGVEKYITGQIGETPPLYILPLHDHILPIANDELHIPLRGFLYIPSASVVSILEYGDLAVFVRRMFICIDQGELLPSWARFVRGMVESPLLQPTASREQIQHDEGFDYVRLALAEQLSTALRHIANEDSFTWRQIVRAHRNIIIGWAVRDNELFAQVADLIPFRTGRGFLLLPEYLALTDGVIYYSTTVGVGLQQQLIHQGQERLAIDASDFVASSFLSKYAAAHPEIQLIRLDEQAELPSIQVDEERFEAIIAFYEQIGVAVRLTRFQPVEIPAVMTFPADAEFFRDAHGLIDAGDLPPTYSDVVSEYLERLEPTVLSGTLCLNVDNPLIQALAATTNTDQRTAGLRSIYLTARLLNGQLLTVSDVIGLFYTSNTAWLNLVETH